MAYLYETHMHTRFGSLCGVSNGKQHAQYYKKLGFQGIIITDHFFGGNTGVPADLPWEKRVELFCLGYEDAWREGQRIGLDVFFGWEQNYQGDEYLIYGLDKEWLLNHPEVEHWNRKEQLEGVHVAGGCVVQAHPFRDRGYIDKIRLGLHYCDGIEAANAANVPYNDAFAYRYGTEYGLPMTAGSDNHNSALPRTRDEIFGVRLEKPLTSIQDYVSLILNHGPIGLDVPKGRFDLTDDMPNLASYWLDENEQPVPTGRDWRK